jgi:hypothetical protein
VSDITGRMIVMIVITIVVMVIIIIDVMTIIGIIILMIIITIMIDKSSKKPQQLKISCENQIRAKSSK